MPSPDEMIQACLRGEPGAWDRLIDAHAGLVLAVARAHRLDAATCDDVAQTVFLALFRRLGDVRDPAQLGSWLAQTTRRECWRIGRDRARRERATTPGAEPVYVADAELEQLERRQRLLTSLDELDPRCQALLRTLFADAGTSSYAQLSEQLGVPLGSLGPTRQRCLAKLADLMGRETEANPDSGQDTAGPAQR